MVKNNKLYYNAEAWDILQYLFKVKKINDHILHFAAEFSTKLDIHRLKQAVNISSDVFPLIRCRFDESTGRWENRNYTSDEMVELIETKNIKENISKSICSEINTENGPQIKITVIRSEEKDTLCIIINHMICDAAGFKEYLYLLASIYTNIPKGKKYTPESGMHVRKIKQIIKAFSLDDKIKIFFKKTDIPKSGTTKFEFEGNQGSPFIETRTIPRDKFCLIKTYAKKHNSTINDIMLTALIRVLFKIFGCIIPLTCTVDLRKYLKNRKADGICNLMTTLNCNIESDTCKTFDETLEKVTLTMNKQKADNGCIKNMALLEIVFDILPYKAAKNIVENIFSNPAISFTNIGILDKEKLNFGADKITRAYMTGSIKYAPNFQLAISTFDNEATLSVNLYGTQSDKEKISDFLDKFIMELQDII